MPRLSRALSPVLVVLLAVSGCGPCAPSKGPAAPGPAAKTPEALPDGRQLFSADFGEVRVGELREMLSLFDPAKLRKMAYDREGVQRLVDYLIGQRVAIEEARATDLEIPDEFLLAPDLTYYNLLYEKFIELSREEFVRTRMTPERLRSHYDSHLTEFTPGVARKRVSLIKLPLTPDSVQLAGRLIPEINSGALPFEEAARRHSVDGATAAKGGELGWWDAPLPGSDSQTAFDQIVKATAPDTPLGGVNYTPDGYYLVRVWETAPPQPRPFDEAANLVRAKIWAEEIAGYYHERMGVLCAAAGAKINLQPLEVKLPENLPTDPGLVLGERDDGTRLAWEAVRGAFPSPPDNFNIGKWSGAAMNRVRALCLEPGLPPVDVSRARMASRWLAGFRRAGVFNRREVEARYSELPSDTAALQQYYERNIARYQRTNPATGQLETVPYDEIAGRVSAHHFREEADKLVDDNFKRLREKRQVRLDDEAVARLVDEIYRANHDPAMKPEEAERISFFHGKD